MFYVYILKSKKDGRLYVGYSHDLKRRLQEHSRGNVTATQYRRPLHLIYYEAYKNEDDTKEREKSLKRSGSVYNGLTKRIKRSIQ